MVLANTCSIKWFYVQHIKFSYLCIVIILALVLITKLVIYHNSCNWDFLKYRTGDAGGAVVTGSGEWGCTTTYGSYGSLYTWHVVYVGPGWWPLLPPSCNSHLRVHRFHRFRDRNHLDLESLYKIEVFFFSLRVWIFLLHVFQKFGQLFFWEYRNSNCSLIR